MQSNAITVLFFIPQVLLFLAWIGAIIYLLGRKRQYPRPAKYALASISIHLLSMLGSVTAQFVAPQLIDLNNMVLVYGIMAGFGALASLASLVLIITAVFIDRTLPAASGFEDGAGVPLADNPDSNPYASPRK